MSIRNRVKELRRVPAKELRPNPKNWRLHPETQHNALRKILAEVGLANACIARELPDGSLMLIDGHLRAETLQTELVPVLVLDVNEEEADTILATFDPIAGLAKANKQAFAELGQQFEEVSQRLEDAAANEEGSGHEDHEDAGDTEDTEDDALYGETEPEVRMVQLFFDQDSVEEFHTLCNKLAAAYGTDGVTSTVLEAVKREAEK